jgi:flagellar basal body-associated protein FliL
MSEAAAEKPAAAPAPGGSKKLLLMVLIFNVMIAGGLGYIVLSGRNQAAAPAKKAAAHGEEEGEEGHADKEAEEEEEESGDSKAHGSKFGPLLEVGAFVANLAASAQSPTAPARYAKVALFVEVRDEEAKTKVEAALVPIKAEALMFLSNAKPEDVIGQDKIKILSEELQKRITALVGKKLIKRVYFSELVVQ